MIRLFFVLVFSVGQIVSGQSELTHKVFFNTASDVLSNTESQRLTLFSQDLIVQKISDVQIVGYCDDRGTNAYNLELSTRRAIAIESALIAQKFPKDIITYVNGKGELLLNNDGNLSTDSQRGLNRRVDIIVTIEAQQKTVKPAPNSLEGKLKVGDKIVLKDILFKTGYSDILKESINNLDKITEILKTRKDVHFIILGHVCCTDSGRDAIDRRTKKFNLSVARAQRVYDYFLSHGISKERMSFKGLGRQFPLGGSNKFDRRVEIEIVKID